LLKLEPAQAKKSELGWLGSARKPIPNQSQAQLGLESRLDFQAKLGSGSGGCGISDLGLARARTYIKFLAGLELGLEK
jgi:hypothetical protein